MNLLALAAAGLPPFGTGVYVRDRVDGLPDVRTYFVNAERGDRLEQARALQDRGKQVWYWVGPSLSKHDTYERGLDRMLESVVRTNAEGILTNPERNRNTGGWMISNPREIMTRFGERCAQIAMDTRVGMVSYYAHPGVREFAAAAGDRVWGSIEIYGHEETDPAVWARWYADWEGYFGSTRLIPSISGWTGGGRGGQGTAAGFQAYLDALPKASGAIAFLGAGRTPAHIVTALEGYSAGGSQLGTLGRWIVAACGRPAGAAILGLLLAVCVVVVGAVGYFV